MWASWNFRFSRLTRIYLSVCIVYWARLLKMPRRRTQPRTFRRMTFVPQTVWLTTCWKLVNLLNESGCDCLKKFVILKAWTILEFSSKNKSISNSIDCITLIESPELAPPLLLSRHWEGETLNDETNRKPHRSFHLSN